MCSTEMYCRNFTFCIVGLVIIYSNVINALYGPSDQPEAYFNGTSYIRLQNTISLKRPTGVSFKTCAGGELLSQRDKDNLIELSVNSEGLRFSAKTNGKTYENVIPGDFIDNKWHTVLLNYILGNITLTIDGSEPMILGNEIYRPELLTSPGLYSEVAILIVGNHYNGCMLEGPSLVFNNSIIQPHNVLFGKCPIPYDSCTPRQEIKMLPGYDYCMNEPCMRQGTCLSGQDSYTCACSPRYTGKNCEIDMGNPCEKKPNVCKNSGICEENNGNFICNCLPNFTGKHCETEIKIHPLCATNPCQNGGTCNVNDDNGKINCFCPPGFSGPRCEINVNECHSYPCKNNGNCIDGPNNYTCDCTNTGYTGYNCDEDINECFGNPCKNLGTCFNTYGSYVCQCATGFYGDNCEQSIKECMSQPCFNNGNCEDKAGGYECHCLPDFIGSRCEIEIRGAKCEQNTCPPYADCRETANIATCVCKAEYPGIFPNCSSNICATGPCRNGGTCTAVLGSFNCTCLPGYTGDRCQLNVDECASMPCANGGACIKTGNSFYCNCTEEWMGPLCEQPYNPCELKKCQNGATCILAPNKRHFTCNCRNGFEGAFCEKNIDDCLAVTCPPPKECFDLINSYECRCPPGYGGDDCTIQLDPCARSVCENGGTCLINSTSHDYFCACPEGYAGINCESDVDECEASNGKICNEGICVNTMGSFQCYCKPGYTGERCNLDFNECLSMPCKNQASCVNKVNDYECICPPGYAGKECSINIDECESNPCMEGSECKDGINGFTCECQAGLTGKYCEINIDDCESAPCLNDATCLDGLNSYTCNCTNTGYTGTHCEININDCIGNPCMNGGECIDEIKDYHCTCYDGYLGKNCEIDVNECESNPCKLDGICLERSNISLYNLEDERIFNMPLPDIFLQPFNYSFAAGYECVCVPGVKGINCEININECESSPCIAGTCVDKVGGYFCECNEGFEGENCQTDIDECERYHPCVHGECIDRKANYSCECEPEYGGKNCSVPLTGCMQNPCLNNGTCKPYLENEIYHKFNCSCPNGFHGDTCEKVTTMSLSGKSVITVNTTREEGYDIQFRFKTTLSDGLLAVGRGLTYYILELNKGRLNLHSSLLNRWEGVFVGSNLNDSAWHKVFVAINASHLVLSANDEQTIYPITNDNGNGSSITSFPTTYIGGRPSNLRKITREQSFVGCTQDVLINNEWVLLEAQNSTWLSFENVEQECHREPQCEPNPCHSGGRCTDMWREFSCSCERPYLGHTCQYNYTAGTFGYEDIKNSLVTVTVDDAARRAVRSIVDISMFIRTRQARGQIFYLGSTLGVVTMPEDTYIAAQLENGELMVKILFNNTPESYTVGGYKLNNGYNHLIEVIRNVTLVQVKLNGTEYFRKTISATGSLDAQVLFLGGQQQLRPVRQATDAVTVSTKPDITTATPATPPLSSIHFKGIIQDVQISNGSKTMVVEFFPLKAHDLNVPMSFGVVSFDDTKVLPGVLSDDSCKVARCHHNGECVNTWNDYQCICQRGFKGKECLELEFCELERHCPSGSECKNLENGYECVSTVTLDGDKGPLIYTFNATSSERRSMTIDSIEFTYRTRSWGTLFYSSFHENYFIVFIMNNYVVVEWSIFGNVESNKFRKENFSGQWLTIYLKIKETEIKGGFKELVNDDTPNFIINNLDVYNFTEIFTKGTIFVGGSNLLTFDYNRIINEAAFNLTHYVLRNVSLDLANTRNYYDTSETNLDTPFPMLTNDLTKSNDRFKGCLGEIRIGKVLIPFFPIADMYKLKDYPEKYFNLMPGSDSMIGCILCQDKDCYNGAACESPVDDYVCRCLEGYAGDDCAIDVDECEMNQCKNNATCIDGVGKYDCECQIGYEGNFCESEIDECQSTPCHNGGTCINLLGAFKCECPEDYVGKQCEALRLITCENQPCKEGATCENKRNEKTGDNFTCICVPGMTGHLCDTPFCKRKECENGGVCLLNKSSPYCNCTPGFDGKYCENNIDECSLPTGNSPCQNNGICIDGVNKFDCNCTGTGYTGLLCELNINECATPRNICGRGTCIDTLGSYKCACNDTTKCGLNCELENPCYGNPCVQGTCESKCSETADYVCHCPEDFGGKNCTEVAIKAESQEGVNILYIVIPIVIILMIGMAIGLIVLVNVARSKRATRGTYSPSAQEFCNPRVELDHVLKPPPEERLI